MEIRKIISPDLIRMSVEVKTCTEALTYCSKVLQEHGYVKESFTHGLLDRESKYPTGIPIPHCGVAIPHCDPQHVNQPAIMVATLKEPVPFRSMEDPDQNVMIEFIFCLAVEHAEDQIKLLPKIIQAFVSEENVKRARNCTTPDELFQFLEDSIAK